MMKRMRKMPKTKAAKLWSGSPSAPGRVSLERSSVPLAPMIAEAGSRPRAPLRSPLLLTREQRSSFVGSSRPSAPGACRSSEVSHTSSERPGRELGPRLPHSIVESPQPGEGAGTLSPLVRAGRANRAARRELPRAVPARARSFLSGLPKESSPQSPGQMGGGEHAWN